MIVTSNILVSSLNNIQTSDIGSFPAQICYCENSTPDCTKQIPLIDIKTGEKMLDLAIVNIVKHPIDGSIKSEIRGHILIRDDQKFQCDKWLHSYKLISFKYSQQLIISPWFEEDSFYSNMYTEN